MKKLTLEDAVYLLVDIINGEKRHRDYKRVVEMATLMEQLITGENMDDLMHQFVRREDDAMFKQRMRITQHITSTVCKNLIKPEYKIPRSNGVRRILKYADDTENQKLKQLEGILGKFWGDKSLDRYLGKRWIDLANLDPNSFIVYEWGEFDPKKEKAQPYPFEVAASEAIYYEFKNNIIQFLVVLNEFEEGAGGLMEKVQVGDEKNGIMVAPVEKRYTMYLPNWSVVFDQLKDGERMSKPLDVDKFQMPRKGEVVNIKGKDYLVSYYDTKLDFVPAARVGFEYDPITRNRTCIPPIWDAVPLLKKTIKANSELDLTMALSAHPQKIQYVRRCQGKGCNAGRLPDGGKCKICHGDGTEDIATSAQEFIKLIMPRDKDEMIPLDDIVRYVIPETAILEFQTEYIKSLTAQCKEAIYNSEIFSRQEIAETATGKNIDLQNVYDALYPMAEAFSLIWETSVYAIARITDSYDGLIYSYIFNKDFKMKTMSELIMDLKTAMDSRASGFIKETIEDDIAEIQYTDDPIGKARYHSQKRFFPYKGKTREEILSIVTTRPTTDFQRVLWEIYGWVFEELERDYRKRDINFYDLAYEKQWTQIKKKVKREIAEREKEQEKMGFNQNMEETEDEE